VGWQVIGHRWATDLLGQGLANGHVGHAYLFAGPARIGKTTLARSWAQALNCQGPEPPCGLCPACQKIAHGTHPDVRIIEGEGAGGSIKISQVRALQRQAMLSPYEGRYRVFVMRRIDLATVEAANSLLKTLEEPPAHVMLVLTAVDAEALPPTVISRCQRLDLRPVTVPEVEAALDGRGLGQDEIALLARLSAGRVGWALDAVQEQAILSRRTADLDLLIELLSADRTRRLAFADQVSRDGTQSQRMLETWIGWWRDLLLLCGRSTAPVVNLDRQEELERIAARCDLAQAQSALKALRALAAHLEANVNPRLALEGLLLQLPRWPQTS
jgi:DNA polymerase-3 subunit delta'